MMQLTFLGATDTVTGSKYLVEVHGRQLLVDCGLFQGYKELRLRNWNPLPVQVDKLSAVLLTHAHIDHSGYLPLLVKNGFRGPIHCTRATYELCRLLLPDCGRLMEEDAEYANRKGFSKHHPAKPLFTEGDAHAALNYFVPCDFDRPLTLDPNIEVRFTPAGHILGAACITVHADNDTLVFSGDLGRQNDLIMRPPAPIEHADCLLVESTYGDRLHGGGNSGDQLAHIVNTTVERGGVVLIPAFAVGRTQTLLHVLRLLRDAGTIPEVPIYLDSPMAINATSIYRSHSELHRLNEQECAATCSIAQLVRTPEASRALTESEGPMIVISASGMATGGRILHHMKAFGPNPRNTIVFSGYQAGGTRGAALLSGAREVKIHGAYVPIRAKIAQLGDLSAHADYGEIITWLRGFKKQPRQVFITHGEPAASAALRNHLQKELGWTSHIPTYKEKVAIT